MVRKIFTAVLVFIFCIPVISFAAEDYAAELKQEQKKLIKLTEQIAVKRQQLKKLAAKYEDADMAMRQQLLKDKSSIDEKAYVRKSKMEQKKLRDGYYKNKKPLVTEHDKLKREYAVCKRAIKKLTKKIDRLANDPDNEAYRAEIEKLKSQIRARKEELNNSIAETRKDADKQITAITDMSKKSAIKKQILAKAKEKELELRREFGVDKAAIVLKIDDARTKYKNNLKLWRMKKDAERKEKQLKKIAAERKKTGLQPVRLEESSEKRADTNFGPAN